MDFSLNEEQRAWQTKARKFADEEIRPITLERDAIIRVRPPRWLCTTPLPRAARRAQIGQVHL